MKVLNPSESFLCDHEVLQHLIAMKARYTHVHETQGAVHAMKAGNLETVMKEVKDYLSTTPAATQTQKDIDNFMSSVSKFALEKAELLMIINSRPSSIAELDCLVEEMDARFDDQGAQELLRIVKTTLPAGPAEGAEGENSN
ncbi:uncharacterized protein H6S33_008969 [Morchella sextelata]|uniref:uncharacterized protein n=1 Tax=Morchella sextelata TaxID=1174677 RepID=UPI001D046614|nr:uncharacterized protein H6S33_008969 [Morchella sextelata]KAH0612589.1 hypothetical protein H6S33_008969 [Morchella sextelata]